MDAAASARKVVAGRFDRERALARKTNGVCCVRQNRVVPTPVAGAKLSVAISIRPDRSAIKPAATVTRRIPSPGRARHKPSSHCAGNAGLPPLNLYARVRISLCNLHTRPRVQRASGIPCSLYDRGDRPFQQSSGKPCREKADAYLLFENGTGNSLRRPGQASLASADPGPIRRGGHC